MITVITTPITVIGSWYGMNFHNMPEVDSSFGYLWAIGLTLVATVGTVFWCKRKGWI
jgi:magnesium transporter